MNNVRYLYVPQRVVQNAILLFVPEKFNFCLKKVVYKVSFCENVQQYSCSYIIPYHLYHFISS